MKTIIAVVPVGTDPEASAIARLCEQVKIPVHRPLAGGKPVHPGNAYQTETVEPAIPTDAVVWRVECDGPTFAHLDTVVVVDHHRPGDPGYGRPPEQFWSASSLGQVAQLVAEYLQKQGRSPEEAGLIPPANSQKSYWPSDAQLLMIAAADHCLAAAYQGLCPGVHPDALMQWRAQSRAEFQRRPLDSVLADIENARRILQAKYDPGQGFADLRHHDPIPELPEAAARDGIPFLATVPEKDGRTKIVLQAAPADLVRQFLDGNVMPGLNAVYGDPARGFAGGYLHHE